MKKIEAPTLQDAYTKASEELGCSITELDFEIVQNSTRGFLGLFRKNAIIIAKCKNMPTPRAEEKKQPSKPSRDENRKPERKRERAPRPAAKEKGPKKERRHSRNAAIADDIVNTFNNGNNDPEVIEKIEEGVKRLFACSCFEIEVTEVSYYDDKTVKVKFDGPDAALLIGKEGYRYKALSYMLFNWINPRYNLLLRLEIAEFLQNQEEQVRKYLEPVKATIKKNGKGQTKPLDGVLVQIALKELRLSFPDKYVAIRTNPQGEKYIIVNEFANRK